MPRRPRYVPKVLTAHLGIFDTKKKGFVGGVGVDRKGRRVFVPFGMKFRREK